MSTSTMDQIKKLDEQRRKLLEDAKQEALEKAQRAVAELNSLGFSYALSSSGRRGAGKGSRQMSEGPCPICKFRTNPAHDGRRHRAQGERKRAFSAQELAEMGYSKA